MLAPIRMTAPLAYHGASVNCKPRGFAFIAGCATPPGMGRKENAVERAIRLLGGTFETAAKLRIQPTTLWRWGKKGYVANGPRAKLIADATGGKVTVEELVTMPPEPARRRDKRHEQRVA